MRERLTTIGWFYLIASIWFVVTAGTTLGAGRPHGRDLLSGRGEPDDVGLLTTGMGGVVATVIAGLLWMRVRAGREPAARRVVVEDVGLQASGAMRSTGNTELKGTFVDLG